MILSVHMVFGAAIGYQTYSATHNVVLAVIAALACHYFLDLFPHVEYPIDHIKNNAWAKSAPDFLKVAIDGCAGLLLVALVSTGQPVVYLFALVAIVPDALTLASKLWPNPVLQMHDKVHTEAVHYLTKQKESPVVLRIATQIIGLTAGLVLLKI